MKPSTGGTTCVYQLALEALGTDLNDARAFRGQGRQVTLRERMQTPGCFIGDLLVFGAKCALVRVSRSGDVTLVF